MEECNQITCALNIAFLWSLVYAEWIWLRVGICFREGGAEPSSLFLSRCFS